MAQGGHRHVVRYLLEQKADGNKCKKGGTSPLMIAAQEGFIEVVRELVSAGVDINMADNDGCTAVYDG